MNSLPYIDRVTFADRCLDALTNAGWSVSEYDRESETLTDALNGLSTQVVRCVSLTRGDWFEIRYDYLDGELATECGSIGFLACLHLDQSADPDSEPEHRHNVFLVRPHTITDLALIAWYLWEQWQVKVTAV